MTKYLVGEEKGRPLTRRERQILALMTGGHLNKEIAQMVGIKEMTVKNHISQIFKKLGAKNRTHAVVIALGGTEKKEDIQDGCVKYIQCPEQPTER